MGIKEGVRRLLLFVAAMVLAFGFWQPASADEHGVNDSEALGLAAVGPVGVPHNFPVWYQDDNGLQLELCLDDNVMCAINPPDPEEFLIDLESFDPPLTPVFGEAFWWQAVAEIEASAINEGMDDAELVLALEATWFGDDDADHVLRDGMQNVFGRVRARVDVTEPGTYTVTHPFGVITRVISGEEFDANADDPDADGVRIYGRGINFTEDLGCLAPGCDFEATLANISNIGPFLTPANAPFSVPFDGNIYLSDPTVAIEVIGSPTNNNIFRVEGPGVPGGMIQTNLFFLMGKIANCDPENDRPIANNDVAVTDGEMAIVINVLENDEMGSDVGINPATVSIIEQPAVGSAMVNPDGTISYDPQGATTSTTFTYTVQDFCGLTSNIATVTVLNEGLTVDRADYRARTGTWAINGTSSISEITADFSEGEVAMTAYLTRLSGAQEVPPNSSLAKGFAAVTMADVEPTTIDILLEVDPLPTSNITAAHIHLAGVGVNAPAAVDICGTITTDPCTPVGDVLTVELFDVPVDPDIIQAILDGNAYVNVHTDVFELGEIRGQLGVNVISLYAGQGGMVIGAAEVDEFGTWSLPAKLTLSPGAVDEIHAESALGNTETRMLRLR